MIDKNEETVVSSTGGQKGRKLARVSGIDPEALWCVAEVFGYGAQKYALHNYLKVEDWSLYYDAAGRHLLKFWAGEDLDPESGLHHLGHAASSVMMLLALVLRGAGTDNRPPGKPAKAGVDPIPGDPRFTELVESEFQRIKSYNTMMNLAEHNSKGHLSREALQNIIDEIGAERDSLRAERDGLKAQLGRMKEADLVPGEYARKVQQQRDERGRDLADLKVELQTTWRELEQARIDRKAADGVFAEMKATVATHRQQRDVWRASALAEKEKSDRRAARIFELEQKLAQADQTYVELRDQQARRIVDLENKLATVASDRDETKRLLVVVARGQDEARNELRLAQKTIRDYTSTMNWDTTKLAAAERLTLQREIDALKEELATAGRLRGRTLADLTEARQVCAGAEKARDKVVEKLGKAQRRLAKLRQLLQGPPISWRDAVTQILDEEV